MITVSDASNQECRQQTPTSVQDHGAEETLFAVRRSLGIEPGEQLPPSALVKVLRGNKFPLLSLVNSSACGLPGNPSHDAREQARSLVAALSGRTSNHEILAPVETDVFATALVEDIIAYRQAHGEYMRLAEEWSTAGVQCICFKSAGIAPSFPYTSDNIDVLVKPHCTFQARQVLRALGYVELRNCEEPQKWLFRRFVAGRSVSAIHLHTQVGWGLGYMLMDALWSRAVRSSDDPWTWVPGREDAALINLAHAWVENKAISLHDLYKIRYALDGAGIDWDYLCRVADERGWRSGLHFALLLLARLEDQLYAYSTVPQDLRQQCEKTVRGHAWLNRYWRRLRNKRPVLPWTIPFAASKALHFEKIWRDHHLRVVEKPAETVLEVVRGAQQKLRLQPQNGMLVALSGPDGSGKTAHARALAQAFSTMAIRNRIVWTRAGATPLIQALHARHANVAVPGASPTPQPVGHPFSRHGWGLAVWATATSIDFMSWLLYVRWRLLRGDVVIADRYVCDFDVELAVRLAGRPRLLEVLRLLVRKVAPVPRRAYLLHLAPEVASQRLLAAGAGSVDDISSTEQCKGYDALHSLYALHVIDAALQQDIVSTSIVHDALSIYMENYNSFCNIFLFAAPWQLNPSSSCPLPESDQSHDGTREAGVTR